MREFTQAGVELIGCGRASTPTPRRCSWRSKRCDAVGLRDARSTSTTRRSSTASRWRSASQPRNVPRAKALIKERNHRRAARARPAASWSSSRCCAAARDGIEPRARVLSRRPSSLAALDRLDDAARTRARALGYGDRVTSTSRCCAISSTTPGFIFEGYVAELGFSLCGGGRYDSLLPRFGFDVPAVGWTAGVERLLIALERRGKHVERRRQRIDVLVRGVRRRRGARARGRQRRALRVGGSERRGADRRRARARHPARRGRDATDRVRELRVAAGAG